MEMKDAAPGVKGRAGWCRCRVRVRVRVRGVGRAGAGCWVRMARARVGRMAGAVQRARAAARTSRCSG